VDLPFLQEKLEGDPFFAYSSRMQGIVKVENDTIDRNALPIFPVFLVIEQLFC
jgi:hypothetical protein